MPKPFTTFLWKLIPIQLALRTYPELPSGVVQCTCLGEAQYLVTALTAFAMSGRVCVANHINAPTNSLKVQVYQVRSLDRPLFIVFVQNSEGIIVTSQAREQGMMECAVSSSLFSVDAIKKRVH